MNLRVSSGRYFNLSRWLLRSIILSFNSAAKAIFCFSHLAISSSVGASRG